MRFVALSALSLATLACAGGSTSDSPGSSSSGNPVVPGGGECGVDKICIDVPAEKNAEAFHLAVLWVQHDDDGPDPEPQFTYDQPVAAGTTRAEIPLSAVAAPTDEKLYYCERAGDDEATSPCLSDPKVTYGFVVAYRDGDGDGKFTGIDKKGADETVGWVNVVMGYAPAAYPKGSAAKNADAWDRSWPDGIQAGVHVYQVARPDNGFDRPVTSTAGTTNTIREKAPNTT